MVRRRGCLSRLLVTAAGTAAGIDACLHLLRQELGAEIINRIARRKVIAPQRDGGQAQFNCTVDVQASA